MGGRESSRTLSEMGTQISRSDAKSIKIVLRRIHRLLPRRTKNHQFRNCEDLERWLRNRPHYHVERSSSVAALPRVFPSLWPPTMVKDSWARPSRASSIKLFGTLN